MTAQRVAIEPQSARPLLTPIEAARILGLDKRLKHPAKSILGMIERGELVGVRVGRYVQVDPDSVDRVRSGA